MLLLSLLCEDHSVNKYLLETIMKKVSEIKLRLGSIQMNLAGDNGTTNMASVIGERVLSPRVRSEDVTPYEVLEGLFQVTIIGLERTTHKDDSLSRTSTAGMT